MEQESFLLQQKDKREAKETAAEADWPMFSVYIETKGRDGKGWSFWGWTINVSSFAGVQNHPKSVESPLVQKKRLNKVPNFQEQARVAEEMVQNGADDDFFASRVESGTIPVSNLGSEVLPELFRDMLKLEHMTGRGLAGTNDVRAEILRRLDEYDPAYTNSRE